jgi:hypothetical protein
VRERLAENDILYGFSKNLAWPPSKPNAVRRGANYHQMPRSA